MASTQELAESWQRLDVTELEAIAMLAKSPRTLQVSRPMAYFLADALQAEADHREDFRTKPAQVPPFDTWTDIEVSDGYSAALMIERAADGGTARLQEWSEMLRRCICNEMAARLMTRQLMKDASCN